jgi:hypothetical protein
MKPEEICPDYREWPKSWMGVDEDLVYGRNVLDVFTRFVEFLLEKGLKKRTVRKHMNNLWLLGGEIIREVTMGDEYDVPVMGRLRQTVGPYGGPFCQHLDTEAEIRSFDATCRKLDKFFHEIEESG